MIRNAQPKVLKQIIRLPRKRHDYYWIITEFDDSAIRVTEGPKRTTINMKGPLLTGFKTIWKSETHFIRRDFVNLKNYHDPSLLIGYVPDIEEIFQFMPLSADQIGSLADIVDEFDYNLYSKIGGVFLTVDQDSGRSLFKESLPRMFEIVTAFFQEVDDKRLNLFDKSKLLRMFNLDEAFP